MREQQIPSAGQLVVLAAPPSLASVSHGPQKLQHSTTTYFKLEFGKSSTWAPYSEILVRGLQLDLRHRGHPDASATATKNQGQSIGIVNVTFGVQRQSSEILLNPPCRGESVVTWQVGLQCLLDRRECGRSGIGSKHILLPVALAMLAHVSALSAS